MVRLWPTAASHQWLSTPVASFRGEGNSESSRRFTSNRLESPEAVEPVDHSSDPAALPLPGSVDTFSRSVGVLLGS